MFKILSLVLLALFLFACSTDVEDSSKDLEIADTVKICEQIWMKQNLNVSHYRNGDTIPEITDSYEWAIQTTGAWCYYNNDPKNGEMYGKLYNWYAVNDPRGLAPDGWHVPSDDEWKELEICLGISKSEADKYAEWRGTDQGSQLAGRADLWADGALKSNSKFGTSGFSAFPGGWRGVNGSFNGIWKETYFWSSTRVIEYFAWYRGLSYDNAKVNKQHYYKVLGFSVRCVKD